MNRPAYSPDLAPSDLYLLNPWRSTWLTRNVQATPMWRDLSPSASRPQTPISFDVGYKRLYRIKKTWELSETRWRFVALHPVKWAGIARSQCSDSLLAGRSRDRIPMAARFSAPVQTCPGAHPTSCTMVTGSYPGGKAAGAWCWPPHLAPKLKKE